MNPFLSRIQEQILNSELIEQEKQALLKSLADADKQWAITDFKLDRTEKVKKTTAILLEETIEELEKKRKAVEAQNKELEIERSLEKVRAVAMGMNKQEDLVEICESLFYEFRNLGFDVLRNAMINIHDNEHASFLNYDYSDEIGKSITPLVYDIHPVIEKQIGEIRAANDAFSETVFKGKDLADWKKFRKERGEKDDPRINDVDGLHYYFYSIGSGSIGISTFAPIGSEKLELLKRFRNVFNLAYQRYTDIAQAAAQAREAQIEAALERVRSRTMSMHKTEELLPAAELVAKELSALGVSSMNVSYAFVDKDEKSASYYSVNPVDGKVLPFPFKFPHTCTEVMRSILESWKKQEPFNLIELDEEGSIQHQTWVGEHIQELMTENGISFSVKEFLDISPKTAVIYSFNFAQGYFFNIGEDRLTTAQEEMVLRFTKVFEMTYRRFLDLQKAEAQAREAQIEAALERTRTRSMLMQHSSELDYISRVFHEQLILLGIESEFSYVWLPDKLKQEHLFWAAWTSHTGETLVTQSKTITYTLDVTEPYTAACLEAWESGKPMFVRFVKPSEIDSFFTTWVELLNDAENLKPELFPEGLYYIEAYMKYGCFGINIRRQLNEEEQQVLVRFSVEFERAYTRFLDLKKAEAQAREGQIQLAMERVRARTMAMQKSEELADISFELVRQVQSLGIATWHCAFNIYDEDQNSSTEWGSNASGTYPKYKTPREGIFRRYYEIGQAGESLHVEVIGEDICASHYDYLCTLPGVGEQLMKLRDSGIPFPTSQIDHVAYFKYGYLLFITYEHVPEAHEIFKRFAKVFEQTYTRFLDLQKAEAQSKEARIEAALERVRSRTMGMQKSDELKEVIQVVFEQFIQLDINIGHTGFVIDYKERDDYNLWLADPNGVPSQVIIKYFDSVYYNQFNEAKKNGLDFFVTNLDFEEKNKFYTKLFEHVPGLPDDVKDFYLNCQGLAISTVLLENIGLYIENFSGTPYSDEDNATLMRFAKVFQQTYTRFLDLQKAETQAREAQIEAALEKVRSRTMAMQRSDELGDAAQLLFQQVHTLGVKLFGSGFVIWDDDKKTSTAWMAGEDRIQPPFKISNSDDVFLKVYDAEQRGEQLYMEVMSGPHIEAHYRYMLGIPAFQKMVDQFKLAIPEFQIFHCAFFSYGYLSFISLEPVPELHDLFKRFAKVFDQTYTRFIDLKKAEALTKEAIKQASLDRIRGQVASMRSVDDLELIIPMLWRELCTLNIPFIRCGVFIMNEAERVVNVFLSSPDGRSLGLLHLPFDTGDATKNAVEHWRKKEVYKEHWNKEEFVAWTQTLIAAGQVHDASSYQGAVSPPESLYLCFVPFNQGMLYVGSAEPMQQDHLELIRTLASTFAIAYSRYEDFRLLEEAKNKIETTLVELKATQSQLVQSEKMASLGELTAGIAHEIQNPLNFVNNFSELSNELIEEIGEEMEKGNREEVNAILEDLRSNLEKINQHGRRADSIVKGMLQHSRSSTGEKEATDINALADEYLRLAYHGFRAKEKSFNALLETDLDQSIGKIKAVPQELGRVLLNLYNNAFYAVKEKSGLPGYDPKVRLSTTKHGNTILIAVEDNGNGIPDKLKEKIFQPFFTTKPTGQGTGLGLSLSYDIVKAHGGEFRVDSKEDVGTSFIIQLPV